MKNMTHPSEIFRLTFPSDPSPFIELVSLTVLELDGLSPLIPRPFPMRTSSVDPFFNRDAFLSKAAMTLGPKGTREGRCDI